VTSRLRKSAPILNLNSDLPVLLSKSLPRLLERTVTSLETYVTIPSASRCTVYQFDRPRRDFFTAHMPSDSVMWRTRSLCLYTSRQDNVKSCGKKIRSYDRHIFSGTCILPLWVLGRHLWIRRRHGCNCHEMTTCPFP